MTQVLDTFLADFLKEFQTITIKLCKLQMAHVLFAILFLLFRIMLYPMGGLNVDGCHKNNKTGEYHCHRENKRNKT